MSTILVTGGTGALGTHVVPLLRDHGHALTLVSRHPTSVGTERAVAADLGEATSVPALAIALAGVDVVVHLAGGATGDDVKTRHLLEAVRAAGTRPHLLAMSVVGADRTPVVSRIDRAMFGYVAAKAETERLVETSGLPWTVLRATQFHTLVAQLADTAAKLPLAMVPGGTRVQPVDVRAVAERVVSIVESGPAGVVELAGPEVFGLAEAVRGYLRTRGVRRPVLGVRLPGRAAAAFRSGANLGPSAEVLGGTWPAFLRTVSERSAT